MMNIVFETAAKGRTLNVLVALEIASGPGVIKLFSCLTQLSMKFFLLINVKMQQFLLINVKMPTIVGILTFMSGKNSILDLSKP